MRPFGQLLLVILTHVCLHGQVQELSSAQRQALLALKPRLAEAQAGNDAEAVRKTVDASLQILGDQAGLPEIKDAYRRPAKGMLPTEPAKLAETYAPYARYLEGIRWWVQGTDPTKLNHALRETATVIRGCLAASRAAPALAPRLLPIARECGDFMLWAQGQAGTGVIPFPAVRGGEGRAFEVAERYLRGLEKSGQLDAVRNGWVAADPAKDGGLQFDNGLGGCALLELHALTGDGRYLEGAKQAADWAAAAPVVSNWNYNSFSLQLLAQAYVATKETRYLDAARRKFRFGVQPGQIVEGPRAGRWADGHNARPAYHYIMARSLASFVAALPKKDPDRAAALACLRRALLARNPEFVTQGIMNIDSTVEALCAVESLPTETLGELGPCGTGEALDILEGHAAAGAARGSPPTGPEAFGLLLERAAKRHK